MCHWCLYKRSVRLFENEKYHVVTAELHCLLRSFDKKSIRMVHALNTFLDMRRRVKQPSIKTNLDPIPDELKDFKKLEKEIRESNIYKNQ